MNINLQLQNTTKKSAINKASGLSLKRKLIRIIRKEHVCVCVCVQFKNKLAIFAIVRVDEERREIE
jgi:hypothetical protein